MRPRNVQVIAPVAFSSCAVVCLLLMYAMLRGSCTSCTGGTRWLIALAGATAWACIAWISWLHTFTALHLGILGSSFHLGFLASEGRISCPWCATVLCYEILVAGSVLQVVRRSLQSHISKRSLINHSMPGLCAIGLGAVSYHLWTSLECPEPINSPREARVGVPTNGFVLIMNPRCPACSRLESRILPHYANKISWLTYNDCSAEGKMLKQTYSITTTPAMIELRAGLPIRIAQGLHAVSELLQGSPSTNSNRVHR
jgi:hypothetical protein